MKGGRRLFLHTTTRTTLLARWLAFSLSRVAVVAAWQNPFSSSRTAPWDASLLRLADRVRQKVPQPTLDSDDKKSSNAFVFDSVYPKGKQGHPRGFCNWLIHRRVMIGQYPGGTPESDGPSPADVQQHVHKLVTIAGVNLYCSLQSEIPAQTDETAWQAGEIYLPAYLRNDFPRPFTPYAGLVHQAAAADCDFQKQVQFLHYPIQDLSVPNNAALHDLLSKLLQALLDDENNVIYLHCWGGRGRAGLVGACLLSLLYPEWDATTVLGVVQSAYASRAGADQMPLALSRSPQTAQQRQFVTQFVQERQRQEL